MNRLIFAAIALLMLGGCVVADPYYYPGPSVGVVYSAPVYRHHHHHRHYDRQYHGYRHWR